MKLTHLSDLIFMTYLNSSHLENLTLGECTKIKTGKLNADAAVTNGKYRFFTCGQDVLFINDYAFDCKAIIVSGNGEISCRFYQGKFNAYQRTYVLEPTNYFYLFLKQCEFSIENLKNDSQGSVIKFITKGMLENITIPISNLSYEINRKIENIYQLIFAKRKQIDILKKNKEILLQKYF